MRKFLEIFNKL